MLSKRRLIGSGDAGGAKRLRTGDSPQPPQGLVQFASSSQSNLCVSCQTINFDQQRLAGLLRKGVYLMVTLPNIESSGCSLCGFFRELRELRPSIGRDYSAEIGQRYELRAHSASTMFGIKNLPKSSLIFSITPIIPQTGHKSRPESIDFIFYGRAFGRCFAEADGYFIQQPKKSLDINKVKEWLDFCDTHHTRLCRLSQLPQLPSFQVIDCRTRMVTPWTSCEAKRGYMTLSYVWGKGHDDVQDLYHELPRELPLLIEDCISLAQDLGYRYLWVDRYCIPQIDKTAKSIQIEKMNIIYQCSDLTIVAAAGNDPAYGLPGVRGKIRSSYPLLEMQGRQWTPVLMNTKHEISKSTWNTRGWTYQEGLLSRRCLVFTNTQSYFKCQGMHCQESIPIPLEALHILSKQRYRSSVNIPKVSVSSGIALDTRGFISFWTCVNEFSHRNLTYQGDALNAFRGILGQFRRHTAPIHDYFGIPILLSTLSRVDTLVYGLTWHIDDDPNDDIIGHNRTPLETQIESATRTHFPSWTWLGWKIPQSLNFVFYNYPLTTIVSSKGILTLSSSHRDLRGVPWFKSCVDVTVRHSDGHLMSWNNDNDEIMAAYQGGYLSPAFRVEGWIFAADIPLTKVENTGSISEKIELQSFAVKARQLSLAYKIGKSSKALLPRFGNLVRLKFLILSRWMVPIFLEDLNPAHNMTAMIIAKRFEDGPYEKIGSVQIIFHGDPHPRVWDEASQSPGPDFKPDCSREVILLE